MGGEFSNPSRSGTRDLAKIAPFQLGPLAIDPPARRISCGERSEMLEPRVMRVLVALCETPGRVLSRDDLIASCWDGQIVGDKAITRAISLLRQAIDQIGVGTVRIETIAKVGFRILRPGEPAAAVAPVPLPPAASTPGLGRRELLVAGAGGLVAVSGGLAAWKAGLFSSSQSGPRSVAVLPFRNLSGDKSHDYFAEGLSEQIRTVLSRNPRLQVMAPTSVAAAMETSSEVLAIAKRLDAAYLLDGSVRHRGDQVRITARLTEAAGGTVAWTDQLDRRVSDIFAAQDDIAGLVERALKAQTADGAAPHLDMGGTRSAKAFDAYLLGNGYARLVDGEGGGRAALAQYDAAIAADPKYAEAHAGRARMIVYLATSFGKASELEGAYDDAIASVRRAAELAPQLPFVQAALGNVLIHARLDFKSASAPFARARELGSGDATVMGYVTNYYAYMGQHAEAGSAAKRATELDPLNPEAFSMAAFAAYCARNYAQSIFLARKALALDSRLEIGHFMIGDCLLQLGRVSEARSSYLAEPSELARLTGLALAEWKLGNRPAAKQAFDTLTAELGDLATYQFATILAQWGRLDDAMAKLVLARRMTDTGLAMLKVDPKLDPLRGRPDFSALLRSLGFA